jgi:multidrug transporter EmrE-like cation transporter
LANRSPPNHAGARTSSRFLDAFIYISSAGLTASALVALRSQLMAGDRLEFTMALLPPMAIYMVGLSLALIAIARNPLSVAYPISIGLAMITSVTGGILFLDEILSIPKCLGILSILIGLFMVSRQSS